MALSDYAEPLFLACTRPVMYFGVPFEGFCVNAAVSYIGYFAWGHANLLTVRGWESLLLFPTLHFAMRFAVAKDPNMFHILLLWIETPPIQPRRSSVLWPMRWWRARSPRDIASGGL